MLDTQKTQIDIFKDIHIPYIPSFVENNEMCDNVPCYFSEPINGSNQNIDVKISAKYLKNYVEYVRNYIDSQCFEESLKLNGPTRCSILQQLEEKTPDEIPELKMFQKPSQIKQTFEGVYFFISNFFTIMLSNDTKINEMATKYYHKKHHKYFAFALNGVNQILLAYHQLFQCLKSNSDVQFKLYIHDDYVAILDVKECTENKNQMLHNSLTQLSEIISGKIQNQNNIETVIILYRRVNQIIDGAIQNNNNDNKKQEFEKMRNLINNKIHQYLQYPFIGEQKSIDVYGLTVIPNATIENDEKTFYIDNQKYENLNSEFHRMEERTKIQREIQMFGMISIITFLLSLLITRSDVFGKVYSVFFFCTGLILFILYAKNGGLQHKTEIFHNLILDIEFLFIRICKFFGIEMDKNSQIVEMIHKYNKEKEGRAFFMNMLYDKVHDLPGPFLIKINYTKDKGFRIDSIFDYSY